MTSSSSNTTLWQAARDGNVEKLSFLIERHVPARFSDVQRTEFVDRLDQFGFTALHWAAQSGHAECVTKLLSSGANVNSRDSDGQTPLHWAVDKEDSGMVQLLLGHKADANAQDNLKHTALHRAAALGLSRISRMLLDRGADVNTKNGNGWTPMHVACYYYHKDILAVLLSRSYGADVELSNKDGWTPLHCAATQGHADMVQILLTHNAAVNARAADQSTPLHAACRGGHSRVVRVLLGAGAATALKDSAGNTPRQAVSQAPAARRGRTLAALPSASRSRGGVSSGAGARPSASNSVAMGDGLRYAIVGQLTMFRVQVQNTKGRYVDSGGANVAALFRINGVVSRKLNESVKIVDNGDGTYTISYKPSSTGSYSLEVTLNRRPIAGSPFAVNVVDVDANRTDNSYRATSHSTGVTSAADAADSESAASPRSPRRRGASSPHASVDDLRQRLHDLDGRHKRLLEEHAVALKQLKEQERALREDLSIGNGANSGLGGLERQAFQAKSAKLTESLAKLTVKAMCIVCKENERDCVLTPCLHMQYCHQCVQQLDSCVTCRAPADAWLQVSL